jgi:RND family efflux transporter MFP subunit
MKVMSLFRSRRGLVLLGAALTLVVAVVGLLAARSALGNGKDKKKDKKDQALAAPVEVTPVGRSSISTYLESTSTLEPQNEATLVARRQGQVVRLAVEEGAYVQKGQVLAVLDDTEARLAMERASLAAEVSQRDFDRGKQLKTRSLVSDKELDDIELKQRSAWRDLEQARYDVSQMRITAPFAGRVTDRYINLGETVTVGKDCFRIADFNPLRARVYFPERELSRVHEGQEATLELDAHPGKQFAGVVSLVNPVIDRANGTFKVTVDVTDKDGLLRPGNFARVRVRTGTFDDALSLPRKAIVSEDGEDFVFVSRADSVNRVKITVGAVAGDTAQIVAGLTEGDSVVTIGQGGLKQGSKIKPVRL